MGRAKLVTLATTLMLSTSVSAGERGLHGKELWEVGKVQETQAGVYTLLGGKHENWYIWGQIFKTGTKCVALLERPATVREKSKLDVINENRAFHNRIAEPFSLAHSQPLVSTRHVAMSVQMHPSTNAFTIATHAKHEVTSSKWRVNGEDLFFTEFSKTSLQDLIDRDGKTIEVELTTYEFPYLEVGIALPKTSLDLTGISKIPVGLEACEKSMKEQFTALTKN